MSSNKFKMTGQISKKHTMIISIIFISFLLCLFVSGCAYNTSVMISKLDGNGEGNGSSNKDIVDIPNETIDLESTSELKWMARWKFEQDREQLVHDVVTDFDLLHPEVDVETVFWQEAGLKSENDIAKKTAEMIKSGNYEYDIFLLNTGQYQRVAKELNDTRWVEKYVVNFGEFDWFNKTQEEFIIANPQYRKEFNDLLIGPYIEGFHCMLWYNKDVADKIGIEIKDFGMTSEDLLEYVKAVYDYRQSTGDEVAAFYEALDWRTLEYMFQFLFKSEVGDIAVLKSGEFTEVQKNALLRTLEFFESMSQYDPLIKSHDDNIWFETRNLILEDKALFTANGAWMYNHWMELDPVKTQNSMYPAELPVFKPVSFYMGSFTPQFAVFKEAKNKENAIEFLKFWSRPQIAEKWIRYTKSPTGIKGHLSESDTSDDQFEKFQKIIKEKYSDVYFFSDNIAYALGDQGLLLNDNVNEGLIDILSGQKTAQEVYDFLVAELPMTP